MKQTIRLTESELNNLIGESVKRVLGETLENGVDDISESISFDRMNQIFDELGISIIGQRDVENRNTGDTGTRYELNTPKGLDIKMLENRLKEAAEYPDGVIVSTGNHRYAPEMTRISVVVVDR